MTKKHCGGQTKAEEHTSRCMSAAQDIVAYAARGDVVLAAQARDTLDTLSGGQYPLEVEAYLKKHGH